MIIMNMTHASSELATKSTIQIGPFISLIASCRSSGTVGLNIFCSNMLSHLSVKRLWLYVSRNQYLIESRAQYLYWKSSLSFIFAHTYAHIFQSSHTFTITLKTSADAHGLQTDHFGHSGHLGSLVIEKDKGEFLLEEIIVISASGWWILTFQTLVNISHFCIHDFSASDHSTGESITHHLSISNHDSSACSTVGIILFSSEVSILVLIAIGFTQTKKSTEKTMIASKKFIKTHPSKMILFWIYVLFIRASGSFLSSSSFGSSHFKRTKPQRGSQLRLKIVHFLSVKRAFALGGIPSQNSCTLTQNFLAERKCPSSWNKIMRENIIMATSIQMKIIE